MQHLAVCVIYSIILVLQFVVQAADGRLPVRYSSATVVVTIIYDLYRPEFQQLPYTFSVADSTPIGTSLFTVHARDLDLHVCLTVACIENVV